MKPIDIGCSDKSDVYFYTAGEQSQKTFYYPLCAGHYFTSDQYLVQRKNYDSFLLIFVKKGEGYVETENVGYAFHEGDVVLIDCYRPHLYKTTKTSELLWVHFDGSNSREYYNMITSGSGPICSITDPITFEKDLNRIFLMLGSATIQDALCSYYLTKVLTDLLVHKSDIINIGSPNVIEDVISYINSHIREKILLDDLAYNAGLSPFYFSRLFKKETGYTPHEYIIMSRINIAKFFLKSSTYSVKEICYNSGFSSESSFCATFRKVCGMTPGEYREQSL